MVILHSCLSYFHTATLPMMIYCSSRWLSSLSNSSIFMPSYSLNVMYFSYCYIPTLLSIFCHISLILSSSFCIKFHFAKISFTLWDQSSLPFHKWLTWCQLNILVQYYEWFECNFVYYTYYSCHTNKSTHCIIICI